MGSSRKWLSLYGGTKLPIGNEAVGGMIDSAFGASALELQRIIPQPWDEWFAHLDGLAEISATLPLIKRLQVFLCRTFHWHWVTRLIVEWPYRIRKSHFWGHTPKVSVVAAMVCGLALTALAEPVSEITLTKPVFRWLWGGFGFHNSEATMTALMSEEFKNERVYKSFLEIAPTYSRVFAGFHNWTKEAMDSFADYYDRTFRKAETTLYIVPGRMPVITEDFDAERYCEDVATRLEYLVKERRCTKLRYYAVCNELSVGPTYAWFGQGHWDIFATILKGLHRAFVRHDLDIGLMSPDSSGYSRMSDIDWALTNVNEQTEVYCWHLYERTNKNGDRKTYDNLYAAVTNLASRCARKEKRISVGEFGFTGRNASYGVGAMRDDAHGAFRQPGSVFARESAISRAEMGIAVLNGGAMHGVSWTMVDYPDPFLRECGDSPEEKARYDVARFSGFGLDIRYNKNGLFRWCDDEHDYSAYPDLYTMGYLVKLFRKGARHLPSETIDRDLRVGAVTNPDGSCSIAVVNWGPAKTIRVTSAHKLTKSLRVYEYDSANPPHNDFNDLQPPKGLVKPTKDNVFSATIPARSLTFFTTDYTDRVPSPVTGVEVKTGCVIWNACTDAEHVYYRVYKNGKQIASTVATSHPITGEGEYRVSSVDRWGNEGTSTPLPEYDTLPTEE